MKHEIGSIVFSKTMLASGKVKSISVDNCKSFEECDILLNAELKRISLKEKAKG
jgi:hypothetical protein